MAERDFLEFVAGILNVPVGELSLETAYQSIPQWDSVMHLRLVMEFEQRYGIEIPIEQVPELKTLRDFTTLDSPGHANT